MVHGSAVSASPETLLEMNILHHHTRAAGSECLGVELNLFSQILQMVPMYTEAWKNYTRRRYVKMVNKGYTIASFFIKSVELRHYFNFTSRVWSVNKILSKIYLLEKYTILISQNNLAALQNSLELNFGCTSNFKNNYSMRTFIKTHFPAILKQCCTLPCIAHWEPFCSRVLGYSFCPN